LACAVCFWNDVAVAMLPESPPQRIVTCAEAANAAVLLVENDTVNGDALENVEVVQVAWLRALAAEAARDDTPSPPRAISMTTHAAPGPRPVTHTDAGAAATICAGSKALPAPHHPPDDLAHVCFTSGSTGVPKAVAVSRGALLSYCRGRNAALAVDATATYLVASAPTFDPFLTDLLACWLCGARAVVAPTATLLCNLQRCLQRLGGGATHVLTTPALWETLGDAGSLQLPRLRTVALGGEAMSSALVKAWRSRVRLYNVYGVTECCGYQTFHCVQGAKDRSCLGDALGENRLVLAAAPGADPRITVDSSAGQTAELWLAGPQVGIGYLNAPPHSSVTGAGFHDVPGMGRCYRTGDLVRAEVDGRLVLLGRRDAQIKINGNRIEPGEVEAVICALAPDRFVRVAVTTSRLAGADPEARANGLVAWCEMSPDTSATAAAGWTEHRVLFSEVMRLLLRQSLPTIMVPRQFVRCPLHSVPLTASGKVNRRALRQRIVDDAADGETLTEDAQLPRAFTVLEALVAAAWHAVLRVQISSPDANFASLSGDSLGALRVVREIHARLLAAGGALAAVTPPALGTFGELGGALSPVHVLERPVLSSYATHLAAALGDAGAAAHTLDGEGQRHAEVDERGGGDNGALAVAGAEAGSAAGLLLRAAAGGETFCVSVLLKHSPDALRASVLDVALLGACKSGHTAAARLLLDHGASTSACDAAGRQPLHWACASTSVDCVKAVLDALPARTRALTAADEDGLSPLHHAARCGGGRRVVQALLDADAAAMGKKRGASSSSAAGLLDARDSWGRTPLHWAIVNGHRVPAEALLSAGANGAVSDNEGETPLAIAERRARCGAQDRPDGLRPSVFADLATLLGGSGATQKR
jgi:acyl-CoA synthetase (AMP-forming)/AMP-acid ligase II